MKLRPHTGNCKMLKCSSPTPSQPLPHLFKHEMRRTPALTAILLSTYGTIRLRWQFPLPGISTHNVNRKVKKEGAAADPACGRRREGPLIRVAVTLRLGRNEIALPVCPMTPEHLALRCSLCGCDSSLVECERKMGSFKERALDVSCRRQGSSPCNVYEMFARGC